MLTNVAHSSRLVAVAGLALSAMAGCATDRSATVESSARSVTMSAAYSSGSAVPATSTSPSTVSTTFAPPIVPAPVVAEGAECGPRGATAQFPDGTVAYCSRLAGTDGAVWSRSPGVAPNPGLPTTPVGPSVGDRCIGADIGRTAIDVNGNSIVCDNYHWRLDTGQEPSHPWADEQREWTECIETNSVERCREIHGN